MISDQSLENRMKQNIKFDESVKIINIKHIFLIVS